MAKPDISRLSASFYAKQRIGPPRPPLRASCSLWLLSAMLPRTLRQNHGAQTPPSLANHPRRCNCRRQNIIYANFANTETLYMPNFYQILLQCE
jgi:hypothetical protein